MKPKLISILLVVALVTTAFLPHAAHAAILPRFEVTGIITDHGNPVTGAQVLVFCESVGKYANELTGPDGSYSVVFEGAQCELGKTAEVSAFFGAKSGIASAEVKGEVTKIDVAIINVSIPEYGWIGGIVAVGTGIGAIAFIRRRYAQQGSEL